MRKVIGNGVMVLLLGVGAGCAAIGYGPSKDSLNAQLPSGVRLLSSDRERCRGNVQVEESNRGLVLHEGQNATFRVQESEDEGVEWSCIGEQTSKSEGLGCPEDTSYVRVTRAGETDQVLFDCYG